MVTVTSRDASEAGEALSGLCQAYWYPIYAYIRHRGYTPQQARDLAQDFFAYILERDLIARADPTRGRFRSILRTICVRYLAAQRGREHVAKGADAGRVCRSAPWTRSASMRASPRTSCPRSGPSTGPGP